MNHKIRSHRNLIIISVTVLMSLFETGYASRCFKTLPTNPTDPVVVDGSCNPKPSKTDFFSNAQAAEIHQVDIVRDSFGLSGKGIKVGIWDYLHVYKEHQEFREWDQSTSNSFSRVAIGDPGDANATSIHATHVAGTIAARGRDASARGIASQSELTSYHYNTNNIFAELNRAAAAGMSISNHSHGFMMGWEGISWEDNQKIFKEHNVDCNNLLWVENNNGFGKYSDYSLKIDSILFNNPNMSAFFAAGNSRGTISYSGGSKHCYWGTNGLYVPSAKKRPPNGTDSREYGTVNHYAVSKNVITIGASEDQDDLMIATPFSSSGPTLDGRVKPDLVANGRDLWSTMPPKPCDSDPASTCFYGSLSGSSMATPVASGIGALLNQQYSTLNQNPNKEYLKSHQMKATLINSALSLDQNGSPNYRTGWGLINASEAVNTVRNGKVNNFQIRQPTRTLFQKTFEWENDNDFSHFTFTWLDPPSSKIERRAAFYIMSPSGIKHFPWHLDKNQPHMPAKRCSYSASDNSPDNCVRKQWDNVLKISIPAQDWEKGEWTINGDLSRLRGTSLFEFSIASSSNTK